MSLKINLTPIQSEIIRAPHRFKVIVAGRRSGKSYANIIMALDMMRSGPRKKVWICMKTRPQAKDTYWDDLLYIFSHIPNCKFSLSELKVTMPNGSSVTLKGTEGDSSLRGSGVDLIIGDEAPFFKPGIIGGTLWPMIADRRGKVVLSSSPYGKGNDFYEYYKEAKDPKNTEWFVKVFTTLEAKIVDPEEIETMRVGMTPEQFEREMNAKFTDMVGTIYINFDDIKHVKTIEHYTDVISVGMDFNRNPMSAVAAIEHDGGLHCIKSYEQYNSDTARLAQAIRDDFPTSEIIVYPDPAGAAVHTSSYASDHNILRSPKFNFEVRAWRRHPMVVDRINAVNLAFVQGKLTIQNDNKQCQRLIDCLISQSYKEGSDQPDKTRGDDHMNDALGYMVEYLYPVPYPQRKYKGPRKPLRLDA